MSGTAALLLALAGAVPIAPPVQAPAQYTVKAGDNLITLAGRWFVRSDSWPTVQRLNRITDPYRMPIGKVLTIPRELLKSEPVGAKVVAFRGAVTLAGKAPTLNAPVREGMAIATGDGGSITVECADGSRFSLPSQTQVGIARLRRILLTGDLDRVFATSQGRGEWRVSPAPTPNSRFMVTTPVSVSAVRGTGFRVGYDSSAVVGVVEGTVGVSSEDVSRATPLPKGKGVAVTTAGVGAPVDLLPAPEIVRPGAVQAAAQVRFRVDPVPGARSYVFEIGSDAGMIELLAELRGSGGEVAFDGLPDGSYFVRAAATDPSGIDGFAKTWAFERLALGAKPPEAIGRGMRFRWSGGGDGARTYRFSLYADEAATRALIDNDGLTDTAFTVTDLKPGSYWWRVVLTKFRDGKAIVAIGELQSFTIAKPE
ncbi:FecR domain-containing protein [Sphingomonas sp. SUN039]|uniref:FecR domain-containing protein n=1 Tax=Sphingomonas sp. SUN039 TaxID=2937787 RepID=UPI002164312C|nr:FecR domain-containing protein [Sphingomonas sp. SUN039]UVO54608.1 FecR domain-containing protein [Sphingomonas sp. SUN039]